MNSRDTVLRTIQALLGLEGLFHLAEFGASLLEEAWVVATLTGIHTLVFFGGVYFVGHDHKHHQLPTPQHDSTWDLRSGNE
ncbi:MAG: hypothetical protein ACTSRU_17310 [Candidatus Hodarchaeales archaeon]